MSQAAPSSSAVQVDARNDLEYCYRDVFQAFVGQGEVTLEFGNVSRLHPDQITIADRIVLSLPSAVRLAQHLGEQLKRAKVRLELHREAKELTAAQS